MTVTLEARSPCLLCGYHIRCLIFPPVRVNKRSLRQTPGNYLTCGPGQCEECGTENYWVAATLRYWLTAESKREVEAYRTARWGTG
jgi:hypothetical protein